MKLLIQSVLVTLIAALAWAWAESDSLATVQSATIVEFTADPVGTYSAKVDDPGWTGVVRVTLRGSGAGIDRTQRAFVQPLVVWPGGSRRGVSFGGEEASRQIALQPLLPSTAGRYVIDLAELVAAQPELRELGVVVTRVEPASVRVVVEARQE
ncbi:MAG: hypothetical protein ACK55O_11275 [Phycisphaerales bacterium]|nr:hypothetical protein [Phycisphaeraceae bacterium]